MTNTRRAFVRNNCRAPILNMTFDSSEYHDAKMYNFSHGGMYFESPFPHALNSKVHIAMVNYTPGAFGHEGHKYYLGRIRWLREVFRSEKRLCGVGVEFLEKGHEIYGRETMEANASCDLCGVLTPTGDIRRMNELADLCLPCFRHMEKISSERVKTSIERFIIGNFI